MKRIRLLLLSIFLGGAFLLVPISASAADAAAGSTDAACEAVGQISPSGGDCDDPDGPSVNKIIKLALNILSIVAGVVAVIMMIVSGFKYVTSQGDSTQISSAKNSLIYVVVGLAVVAFAQFIVRFVLSKSIGA